MKSICSPAILLLTLSLAALAPAARAQVPVKLNFALTATYQAPDATSGADDNITKSTTKTLKFTTATFLALAGTNSGTNFPAKSVLLLDLGGGTSLNVGTVSVVDPSTNTTDVSAFISFTLNNDVYTGTADSDKGTTVSSHSAAINITFDDGNGNSGNLTGVLKISDNIAALTKAQVAGSGVATESVLMSGSLNGYGTVIGSDGNTDSANFTGTITATGKGPSGT